MRRNADSNAGSAENARMTPRPPRGDKIRKTTDGARTGEVETAMGYSVLSSIIDAHAMLVAWPISSGDARQFLTEISSTCICTCVWDCLWILFVGATTTSMLAIADDGL